MTKKYMLIGNPIDGSLSPQIHNTAFRYYNIDAQYSLLHTEKEQLAEKIELIRSGKIQGANITMPYKTDVIPFLDTLSPIAAMNKSVNTVYISECRLAGDSTDGFGALKSLEEEKAIVNGMNVAIIGTGGSAKAVLAAIANKYNVNSIVLGRTSEKIDTMIHRFSCRGLFVKDAQKDILAANLIINATPIGMSPNQNAIPINPEWLKPHHIVFDLIYKPLKTKLLQEAENRKIKIINGLSMLIHQGAKSFELWTGINPTQIMQTSIRKMLSERMENH